jgi:hypothetical protein
MKTRHFLISALVPLALWLLGPGCTQDFDVFRPCASGEKVCDGACAPTDDPQVGCGSEGCEPCAFANADAACDQGKCTLDGCQNPFRNCDESPQNGCETNLLSDVAHCGGCNQACSAPHAEPACEDGDCAIASCDPGWEDCNGAPGDGCEANLQSSSDTCGQCDIACPAPLSCQAGECVLVCDPGLGDCNDDPADGCETPLSSLQHCGGCDMPCDLPNATPICSAGTCQIEICDPGFDDCDGSDASGCEAPLNSTLSCGMCGNECPEGPNVTTVTCSMGACQVQCNAGFGDCDGDPGNGCETDVTVSEAHCGGCDQPCSAPNGAAECNAGACQITSCTAPFEDCNGNPADGCEANTQTSPAHCGACAMPCSFPNAAGLCNAGTCALGPCTAPFEDCNGNPADGCEANTATSAQHCGACNDPCPGGANAAPACAGGVCGLACNAGFDDCNAMPGCETNTATNVDHCGECDRPCLGGNNVASRSCTAGLCNSTCTLGFANCNAPAAPDVDNGCETNVTANDDSCGGCGNSCTLQGGANDLECDGGFALQQTCGCSSTQECTGAGVNAANAACSGAGRCSCGPVGSLTACAVGESCVLAGGQSTCSCGGGLACAAGETCCQTPDGCKDLQTDPQSCGACGHACPPGFACNAGVCQCDADADCNAGSAGTCNSGVCSCGPMMTSCGASPAGRRCQPNGQCG